VALVPRPKIHLIRFFGILAPNAKARSKVIPKPASTTNKDKSQSEPGAKDANTKQRMDWARRLKKVFDIDISVCPNCQGQLKVIAAIEDSRVIKKILNHLNLPSERRR